MAMFGDPVVRWFRCAMSCWGKPRTRGTLGHTPAVCLNLANNMGGGGMDLKVWLFLLDNCKSRAAP